MSENPPLFCTSNTTDPPPSVYIAGQVLRKLLATYSNGIEGQESLSNQKSSLIYSALDAHPSAYKVVPTVSARSRMNICFRVTTSENIADAEKAFLAGAAERGLTGLKGHRSVGGIRASNYNSISLEGAEKLAKYIRGFAEGKRGSEGF